MGKKAKAKIKHSKHCQAWYLILHTSSSTGSSFSCISLSLPEDSHEYKYQKQESKSEDRTISENKSLNLKWHMITGGSCDMMSIINAYMLLQLIIFHFHSHSTIHIFQIQLQKNSKKVKRKGLVQPHQFRNINMNVFFTIVFVQFTNTKVSSREERIS